MAIDISLWNNIERLRIRIKNLGTMVLSITAVNGFYMISQRSWILLGINCLFFITTIPLFLSYGKWQKTPPAMEEGIKDDDINTSN